MAAAALLAVGLSMSVVQAAEEPADDQEHQHHHGMTGMMDDQQSHEQTQADTVKAAYVCPMHPEVRQEQPGRCPTCGMALEAPEPRHTESSEPVLESPGR
jgi:Cu+-exporting ATPase